MKQVRFEPTVNWGHVLIAASMLVSVLFAYADVLRSMDGYGYRITSLESVAITSTKHEQRITTTEQRVTSLEQGMMEHREFQRRILEQLSAIREDIAGMRGR